MKKITKILGAALLSIGAFLLLSTGMVFAAVPGAGATFTGTALGLTAGTTTAINELIVQDATAQEITDTNDIYIRIPTAVNAIWDTTDTSATVVVTGGGCGAAASGTVTYPSSKILKVDVTTSSDNASCAYHISALSMIGTAASTATALDWSIDGGSNYSAGNATTNVSVAAATITASAVKSSPTSGSTGNVALTLTLPRDLQVGEKIKVTFPNSYTVAAGSSIAAGGITANTNSSTLTASAAGQILTLTVGVGSLPSGSHVITIPGADARPDYVDTTDISLVTETTSGDVLIGTVSGVALTDTTAGTLSSATITPNSLAASSAGYNTVTFTTNARIWSNGKIIITYPSGWITSYSNNLDVTNLSGLDGGTWTATVSGQSITIAESGNSVITPGAVTFRLPSIGTPSATGSGGDATITTYLSNGTTVIESATVALGTVFTANSVTGFTTGTEAPSSSETKKETSTTDTTVKDTTNNSKTSTDTSTDKKNDTAVDNVITLTNNGAPKLSDIEKSWAKTEIEKMTEKGIVKGNKDGTFKPENFLNKADAAVLICRVMKIDEMKAVDADPASDVKKADYFGSCVSQLKSAKVVTGNPDGTYTPGKDANRAEFIALALRAYGTTLKDQAKTDFEASMTAATPKASFKDVNGKDWYANVAATAKDMKFVNGRDGNFDGAKSITRAEATTVLYRIFKDLL